MRKYLHRRITTWLLSCVIVIITIMGTTSPVKAINGTIALSCDKAEVSPGEVFDITISVDEADALAGFLIYVYCDTNAFSAKIDQEDGMIRVQKGSLTSTGTLIANNNADKGWQALWFSTDNVSGSGTLFTLTLIANEHIDSGEYRLSTGYSQENTIDAEANLQVFGTQDLIIQVPGDTASEDEEDDVLDNPSKPEEEEDSPVVPNEDIDQPEVLDPEMSVTFSDVSEQHWAFPYITELANRKVLTGPGDGLFYPDNCVTRAEFVAMLAKMHGGYLSNVNKSDFADVAPNDWFAPYVYWASSAGIVTGISESEFAPHMLLTREQMATIIMRYCAWIDAALSPKYAIVHFTDADTIADYAATAIASAQTAGVLTGYPDGSFGPQKSLTRCEAAKVLYTVIALTESRLIVG